MKLRDDRNSKEWTSNIRVNSVTISNKSIPLLTLENLSASYEYILIGLCDIFEKILNNEDVNTYCEKIIDIMDYLENDDSFSTGIRSCKKLIKNIFLNLDTSKITDPDLRNFLTQRKLNMLI